MLQPLVLSGLNGEGSRSIIINIKKSTNALFFSWILTTFLKVRRLGFGTRRPRLKQSPKLVRGHTGRFRMAKNVSRCLLEPERWSSDWTITDRFWDTFPGFACPGCRYTVYRGSACRYTVYRGSACICRDFSVLEPTFRRGGRHVNFFKAKASNQNSATYNRSETFLSISDAKERSRNWFPQKPLAFA